MEQILIVKNKVITAVFNCEKSVSHFKSDYFDSSILDFLNANLPKELKLIPKIEEYLNSMIDEYTKNDMQ